MRRNTTRTAADTIFVDQVETDDKQAAGVRVEDPSGRVHLQRVGFSDSDGIGLNIFNGAQGRADLMTFDAVASGVAVWNDTKSTLYTDEDVELVSFGDEVPQGRVRPLAKAPDDFLMPDDPEVTALRTVRSAYMRTLLPGVCRVCSAVKECVSASWLHFVSTLAELSHPHEL